MYNYGDCGEGSHWQVLANADKILNTGLQTASIKKLDSGSCFRFWSQVMAIHLLLSRYHETEDTERTSPAGYSNTDTHLCA